MSLKYGAVIGALIALLSLSLLAGYMVLQPTTVNTIGVSECDPTVKGHCYAPARVGPHFVNDSEYVLNVHEECNVGEGVDKSGCVPNHGDEVVALCKIEGSYITDMSGEGSNTWIGVDVTDLHANDEAAAEYEFDGVPVGLISEQFLSGIPWMLGTCTTV